MGTRAAGSPPLAHGPQVPPMAKRNEASQLQLELTPERKAANSSLSESCSTDLTEYANLPSFLKYERQPMSTRATMRVAEPEILQFVRFEFDKFNQVHEVRTIKNIRRTPRKRQTAAQDEVSRHVSGKADEQLGRSRGERWKVKRSLIQHRIPSDPSSDPSNRDSDSSSSCSSDGGRKWAETKTDCYTRKIHNCSTQTKPMIYKRKSYSANSQESSEASGVEKIITMRVSNMHLRDFNP